MYQQGASTENLLFAFLNLYLRLYRPNINNLEDNSNIDKFDGKRDKLVYALPAST